ncbi:MAG: ABC transporter substrate-binding protein [Anaerolineales bacterium]
MILFSFSKLKTLETFLTMKNKTLLLMLASFLVLSLLLGACAPAAPTESPKPTEAPPVETTAPDPTEEPASQVMAFTDDLGYKLEFAEYPQAIVSISPSTTEILFAIGAGGQVVGRDEMSLFPEAALEVTSVGALWGELPAEAILALEPDLVVAAQIISEEQVQALRDLGLNVYWQANPTTYEELWDNIRDFAALTGHEEEAEALIADLDARVKAVQEKIAPLSYRPGVFYELDATDPAAPWTAGSGTFIDYIIDMAGGMNAAAGLEGDYIQISAEQLIAVNPDVILLSDALYGVTPESVAERPGWDAIVAVQNNAIYPIDPNLMSVPGPRLVDALEETAKILHPEAFE